VRDVQPPQLVIFDCDGVLVDSEPISNGVLARCLTEAGVPTSLDDAFRDYKGLMLDDVLTRAEERLGRRLPETFLADYERERAAEFRALLKPIAGAAEVVGRIKDAGIAVCVASQGRLRKSELTLGLTDLRSLFGSHAVFSAYEVPRGKPHPDLFLHAARVMGATPATSVVVEDTPSGVAAAVSAGMRAIGYAAGGDGADLGGAGADVIDSLAQLPGLIGLV
jgi:HAD superfamily hydrolase (TIGR01509 family)